MSLLRLPTKKPLGGYTVRYSPDAVAKLNDPRICDALDELLNDRDVVLRKITLEDGTVVVQAVALDCTEETHEYVEKNSGSWGNGKTIVQAIRWLIGVEFGGSDTGEIAYRLGRPFDTDNRADPEDLVWPEGLVDPIMKEAE